MLRTINVDTTRVRKGDDVDDEKAVNESNGNRFGVDSESVTEVEEASLPGL